MVSAARLLAPIVTCKSFCSLAKKKWCSIPVALSDSSVNWFWANGKHSAEIVLGWIEAQQHHQFMNGSGRMSWSDLMTSHGEISQPNGNPSEFCLLTGWVRSNDVLSYFILPWRVQSSLSLFLSVILGILHNNEYRMNENLRERNEKLISILCKLIQQHIVGDIEWHHTRTAIAIPSHFVMVEAILEALVCVSVIMDSRVSYPPICIIHNKFCRSMGWRWACLFYRLYLLYYMKNQFEIFSCHRAMARNNNKCDEMMTVVVVVVVVVHGGDSTLSASITVTNPLHRRL